MLLLALVLWFAFAVATMVAIEWAKPHRTDINQSQSVYDGGSRAWQSNVLRKRNYTDEGKRKLKWIYLAMAGQLAALGSAIALSI